MAQIILRQETIEKINKDQILFGKMAHACDVAPITFTRLLKSNTSPKLTQATAIKVLREHLNVEDSELLEEMELIND